ncbi:predicted protein [Mycobacterium tuberculosis T17]|nr:predicted protein [Mycobacterium tuberculosis T17]
MDGGCVVRASVVRPKTPRGDGNPTMASKSAWVTDPGRQTQNPERGRKPSQKRASIMRVALMSSDPKPREGTETMLATIFAVVVLIVVRPKTPRGDGNAHQHLP